MENYSKLVDHANEIIHTLDVKVKELEEIVDSNMNKIKEY